VLFGNVDWNWSCEGVFVVLCGNVDWNWIVKVLFVVLCVNVYRNWSCEGVVCLIVDVNVTQKHVLDISVDAVSGCEICSVLRNLKRLWKL
jgi:hypothetical protein